MLCPNCRKLISRDEPSCPYCGLSQPGAWWKSSFFTSMLRNPDQLLRLVIGTNVVMYVLSLLLNPRGTGMAMSPFAFLSPDNRSLLLLGATGTVPVDALHRWWSLLAANYLHGSLLHILFNMLALRQLGPLVMQEYGLNRTIIIYTLGGIIGYLVSYWAGVRFTIGASAAVCALIGAILFYGKHRGGHYGQALFSQVGGWAVGIFVFGLLVPGINNWGHGGGMAGGALLGLLLGYLDKAPENLTHRLLAAGCLLGTALVLVWGTGTAFFYRFLG